jgi:hypothetical protein
MKGLGGVRLQSTLYLGKRMCSLRAAAEFLEATNRGNYGEQAATIESRTNRARESAVHRAEAELEKAGA